MTMQGLRPELYWTLLAGKFWTPSYSPDLAPSDFHLFGHLKHNLGGNHYNDEEDVKTAVTSWLSEQAASFYEESIQNLVVRTLQQLAEDEKSRFPLSSEVLLHDTYMDDIVSGAPDLETARRLQSQLRDALKSCGMTLHKWSSNSPELLNSSLSTDLGLKPEKECK
ncbi:hypothetical protein AVEN_96426-1 [Araneus ventricosus]|uniref:Histone-lysine N-methyltransferase SETMAR n=1 Tax=Araneus ventricosus TaxID=182803 RepID=A0A4Y2HX00_ARAVE|nr:hypothetical protein AVEN_96426-1 [Araneus ventricosus]